MPQPSAKPFASPVRFPFHWLWSLIIALPLALSFMAAAPSAVRADDEKPQPPAKVEKAPPKEKAPAKEKATPDAGKPVPPVKEPPGVEPTTAASAWKKSTPESIADLKAIQDRVQELVKLSLPRVVGLRVGNANGSGVIISKEGYILTAGHVSATPDRPVDIILHNGKVVRGKSLGRNTGIDSGLVKINEGEAWDFAEMGESDSLKQGDWCIAIGHPGGYMRGRPPVVRLGRIISASDRVVWTDATLVGGDSGGPLFDMDGKVIAIHSRISASTNNNFHVPIDTYRATWDRLAAGEDWTDRQVNIGAYAGFNADPDAKGARITSVSENSPAMFAKLEVGDIITRFDGARVRNLTQIIEVINRKRPNDRIEVELLRGGETVKATMTLQAGFRAGPFLGISGQNNDKGVGIEQIITGTPAANASMKKDDIITRFDGQPVKNLEALQGFIGKKKAGDSAEVEILRGDETIKLKLILGMRS